MTAMTSTSSQNINLLMSSRQGSLTTVFAEVTNSLAIDHTVHYTHTIWPTQFIPLCGENTHLLTLDYKESRDVCRFLLLAEMLLLPLEERCLRQKHDKANSCFNT